MNRGKRKKYARIVKVDENGKILELGNWETRISISNATDAEKVAAVWAKRNVDAEKQALKKQKTEVMEARRDAATAAVVSSSRSAPNRVEAPEPTGDAEAKATVVTKHRNAWYQNNYAGGVDEFGEAEAEAGGAIEGDEAKPGAGGEGEPDRAAPERIFPRRL